VKDNPSSLRSDTSKSMTTKTTKNVSPRLSRAARKIASAMELIGPDLAREYLDLMPRNRRQRPRIKERYGSAMTKRQWKITGEAVKFNTRGELIDGQHRLEAIIASGQAVEILVVRNVPPDAVMELDTGAGRTPADLLTVAGYDYTSGVASAIRHITSLYKVEAGTIAPGSLARERVDPETLLEYAEAFSDALVSCVRKTMTKRAKTVLSPPSMFAALYYIFAEYNQKGADQFFDTLIDGIGYEHGKKDPIYQLRTMLERFKDERHVKRAHFYKGALVIKAWNAFQDRDTISQLKYAEKESWPVINRRKTRLTESQGQKRTEKREEAAKRKAQTAAASKKKAASSKKKSSKKAPSSKKTASKKTASKKTASKKTASKKTASKKKTSRK